MQFREKLTEFGFWYIMEKIPYKDKLVGDWKKNSWVDFFVSKIIVVKCAINYKSSMNINFQSNIKIHV